MSAEAVPRESVLTIVKNAAAALRGSHAGAHDPQRVPRALAAACRAAGVATDAFDAAVEAEPEHEQLKSAALREAMAGSADPGPNAEISRESMSGQPGDLTKSRSEPEP